MASLTNIYIKKETLETLLKTTQAKGDNGVSITIALNDSVNQWQQNASAYVTQTKEQREAKKDRYYVGNGRTVWTDGTATAFEYKPNNNETTQQAQSVDSESDLPY